MRCISAMVNILEDEPYKYMWSDILLFGIAIVISGLIYHLMD